MLLGTAAKLETAKEMTVGQEKRKDIYDGDSTGQVNLYLFWRSGDIVDRADKWEISVGLTENAHKDQCTVDITPGRLQKFKPQPKTTYKWTNSMEGKVVQRGKVVADEWGLVTMSDVIVGKKENRIVVSN